MKEKKKEDMTLKEYWEDCKKKGESEIIEDPNFGVLTVLRREGFSDEQLNKMKIMEALRLYRNSIWSIYDKHGATPAFYSFLKNVYKLLKDKKKE
jgi:hypothetical protein